MRDITGNTKRDREINEQIERQSVRVSQSGRLSRTRIGSMTGRNSQIRNSQSCNTLGTQNTNTTSRINLEDELKMHREYRLRQLNQQNRTEQNRISNTNIQKKKMSNDGTQFNRPSVIRERTIEDTRESRALQEHRNNNV